ATVAIGNLAGVAMLALAIATPLALGRWMNNLLGGLTGDAYGAINEVTSVLLLLLAVGLGRQAVSTFGW
ncbi:MAG: adenosylcobinamide-GDP ribazoletransferase, partial [Chloroflexi bacterium]|nr:adenosylcobinamide-GDP ribazoletransferase [Chloroflexota bacterium]